MVELDMRKEHRKAFERIGVVLLLLGAALGVAGNIMLLFSTRIPLTYGALTSAAAVVFMVGGLQIGHSIRQFRTFGLKSTGGSIYDQRRYWTQLKVSSFLLNLLAIIAGIILVGALLTRIDALNVTRVTFDQVARLSTVVTAVIAMDLGIAFWFSLRTHIQKKGHQGMESAFFQLAMAAAIVFGLISATLAYRGFGVSGVLLFRQEDLAFYVMAAHALLVTGLFISRGLPTIMSLFKEEKDYYRGRTYMSTKKSVVMPSMIAFALLFVVLLLAIVFQLGVAGQFQTVSTNTILVGVIALIALALIATMGVAFTLARGEDKTPLFRRRKSREQKQMLTLLGVSLGIAFILLVIALYLLTGRSIGWLGLDTNRWIDLLAWAVLISLGPIGFYISRRARRVRRLEERFPDFLRDLASSRKAGLTMESAVQIAAKGEYGELTPEIQKMADQLSWNVPFEEALERFAKRVNTPLTLRAINLIIEASKMGGHVTDVLMAAAVDAREIKNLEAERRTNLGLYTGIVYITFLVFLVVAGILYATFLPQTIAASEAAVGAGGAGGLAGISFEQIQLRDYYEFYFLAAMTQGIGNGIVAGLMESGRATMGLRHSFVMVTITYVTFAFFL
jgi:flagellar protein FlaJ